MSGFPSASQAREGQEVTVAKCQFTGKSRMSGNLVSHSNRKTRTVRKANIRSKRIWDPEKGQFVRMDVSTRALRTLTRKGWDAFKTSNKG
ncbi:MAG: 50S ribosomal protein L28 [Deltaproteobacteria bacterium]|nr:50S ribosomal protein L28 [Deltaproteobacteria bacterium]